MKYKTFGFSLRLWNCGLDPGSYFVMCPLTGGRSTVLHRFLYNRCYIVLLNPLTLLVVHKLWEIKQNVLWPEAPKEPWRVARSHCSSLRSMPVHNGQHMNQGWGCLLHVSHPGTHPLEAELPIVGPAWGAGQKQQGESTKWQHTKAMAVCRIHYFTNNPLANQLSCKVQSHQGREASCIPKEQGPGKRGKVLCFNLQDSQLGKIVCCWLFLSQQPE